MARKLAAEIDASTALTPTGTDKVMVTRAGGVDHVLVSALDARYVNVAGDTMTGALVVPDATADGQALAYDQAGARVADINVYDVAQTVDNRRWRMNNQSGNLYIQALDNAGAVKAGAASLYLNGNDGRVLFINATSVAVPVPSATGHALRQGSAATVTTLNVESSAADIKLVDTPGTADEKTFFISADSQQTTLRALNDAGANTFIFAIFKHDTGATDLSGSTSVTVPTPTAVGHAVKVVAWDATTKRYAVQGPAGVLEQGDTGWRAVSAAAGAATNHPGLSTLYIRRVGNECTLSLQEASNSASGTGTTVVYAIPTGFGSLTGPRAYSQTGNFDTGGPSDGGLYVSGTNAVLYRPGAKKQFGSVKWVTNDAWPSSLPGSAYP